MKHLHRLLPLAFLLAAGCGGGGSSPATFNLTFQAPGGSGLAGGTVSGLVFKPTVTRNFNLKTGITVSGQVTDGTGAPLAGVDVSFHASATSPEIDSDTTDGTGNYSVTLPAGTWMAVLDSTTSALGQTTAAGVVVGSPGPVTADFQFPLPVTLSGSVFEELGAAIPGAQIDFTGSQTGAQVSVTCDGTGFYTASLVPDTYEAKVQPAGGAAATQLEERFASILVSASGTQDFTLTAGVQVSGTILDDLGMPLLEDTDVKVILPKTSQYSSPSSVTANPADGTYSIGPVPKGKITFQLEPPRDSGFPFQRRTHTVVGPTSQTDDFMLTRGVFLTGTIVEDDGLTPSVNAKIEPMPLNGSLAPEKDNTSGAGTFQISLFKGTYDVMITPDKPTDLQLPEIRRLVITGDTIMDVTLTRGAMLSGTVFQPDGITPQQQIQVEIPGVLGASAESDGNGMYSFLAPAGTHTLTLTAVDGIYQDFALDPVAGVVVTLPGPVTQDLTMVLATTGSTVVQGTVYAADGTTPVAGADVAARNSAGTVLGRAISAANGGYVLAIP